MNKIYIVMRNWCDGYDSHDVIENIYTTHAAARHIVAVLKEYCPRLYNYILKGHTND